MSECLLFSKYEKNVQQQSKLISQFHKKYLNESHCTLLLFVFSCLLSLTGLAGAHGMLFTPRSQLRVLNKALKGNYKLMALSQTASILGNLNSENNNNKCLFTDLCSGTSLSDGGTPPKFLIIDDGWQQIENKAKDTNCVVQEGAQ